MADHSERSANAQEVTKALGGSNNMARCPVPGHKDKMASLSVNDAEDGKLLWKCHGGCSQSQTERC